MESRLPFFSIIVPTYNRPDQLTQCLHSLAILDYPRDRFEVIIVDDGSEMSLTDIVKPFKQNLDIDLIHQSNAGPAAARNRGAINAKGNFLAFTDDDCEPQAQWLKVLADYVHKFPHTMIGGKTINKLTHNIYSKTSQLIVDIVYHHYNHNPINAGFFASNNMVIPLSAYREINGFNESFKASEDRELCDRWRFDGRRLVYAESAVIRHAHELTLRSFCRQHFAYGRGAYLYHRIRRERRSGSILVEMRFHANLKNWLLNPFRRVGVCEALPLAILLILWQIVNAAGYFYEKLNDRKSNNSRA